jgi:hypothetical protein
MHWTYGLAGAVPWRCLKPSIYIVGYSGRSQMLRKRTWTP